MKTFFKIFLIKFYSYQIINSVTFISNGPAAGDSTLGTGDDNTFSIPLGFTLPYFQTSYTSIYVSINGFFMLGTNPASPTDLWMANAGSRYQITGPFLIAPYMYDFLSSSAGDIYYRHITDAATLTAIGAEISSSLSSSFTPNNAFVFTWNAVKPYAAISGTGSFQIIFSTDGTLSYMTLYYTSCMPSDGRANSVGLPYCTFEYQNANNLLTRNDFSNPCTSSNINQNGKWIFKLTYEEATTTTSQVSLITVTSSISVSSELTTTTEETSSTESTSAFISVSTDSPTAGNSTELITTIATKTSSTDKTSAGINPITTSLSVITTESITTSKKILNATSSNMSFIFNDENLESIVSILQLSDQDINGCLSNCSNNGVCLQDHQTQKYKCLCDNYFAGSSCNFDVRPCFQNPCLNNASCSIDSNTLGYVCKCSDLYRGTNCELAIDICQNETCSGNGVCVKNSNSKPECGCYQYYSGDKCEIEAETLKTIKKVRDGSAIIAIIFVISFYLIILLSDLSNYFMFRKNKILRKNSVQPNVPNYY